MEKIPDILKMDFMISPVSPDSIRELLSIKLCFVLKLFQEFQKAKWFKEICEVPQMGPEINGLEI